MALTVLEQATVVKATTTARYLVEQLKPMLDELNILYDAMGGLKVSITQNGLDAVTGFSGLTKAQLDDGMYVMTATLRADLTNGYTQLVQLAARAG